MELKNFAKDTAAAAAVGAITGLGCGILSQFGVQLSDQLIAEISAVASAASLIIAVGTRVYASIVGEANTSADDKLDEIEDAIITRAPKAK